MTRLPRHLRAFDTATLPQEFCDVVVLGSGIAGLMAAIEAASRGRRVVVLTKGLVAESNTLYAQAGIAAALSAVDSMESHFSDTVAAGDGLCDEAAVRTVLRAGPDGVRRLEELGVQFDRLPDGRDLRGDLCLGREGGHTARRVVHAGGDGTGREIQRALVAVVAAEPRIRVLECAFAVDLLTVDGRCVGALAEVRDELRAVWGGAVVLATGGAARVFRESTNPAVSTGDGIAMAYRAGAAVRDLEFMQFHPTVLYVPGAGRMLISEAARGEGALILDQRGKRFLHRFDERGEMAPRDVVSRGIVAHMLEHGDTHVFLDLRSVSRERLHERLPGVVETGRQVGLDVTTDPVPVRPAAHYTIGGVMADTGGATTVPGLFAAGEVSSIGLHGANRLASNSLLEGVVMGPRVGAAAADASEVLGSVDHFSVRDDGPGPDAPFLDTQDLVRSIRSLAWRQAGVRRDEEPLLGAVAELERWAPLVLSRSLPHSAGLEAQNLCILAQLLSSAALARRETRGVHWRIDFPERDDEGLRGHFVQEMNCPIRFDPISSEEAGGAA